MTLKNTFIVSIFLSCTPIFSYAYSVPTHENITRVIVENARLQALTFEERNAIIRGSADEDEHTRPTYHFYDPIYNRGLTVGTSFQSSKLWVQDTVNQARYCFARNLCSILSSPFDTFFSSPSDYSWDRGVYEYAHGDKIRGLETLGHALHLVEDATVPAHVRNDQHLNAQEWGLDIHDDDSYEHYTTSLYPRLSISVQRQYFSTISEALERTAYYTNTNFYSDDTIRKAIYKFPVEEMKEGNYIFSGGHGVLYQKVDKNIEGETVGIKVSVSDEKILSSSWSLLSHKAIENGVGVVDLFFRDVLAEKKSGKLLAQNTRPILKKIETTALAMLGVQDDTAFAAVNTAFADTSLIPHANPPVIIEFAQSSVQGEPVLATNTANRTVSAFESQPVIPHLVPTPAPTLFIPLVINTNPVSQGIVLGASIDTTQPPAPAPFTLSGGAGQGGGGTPGIQTTTIESAPVVIADTTPPTLTLSASACIGSSDTTCHIIPGTTTLTIDTDGDTLTIDGTATSERTLDVTLADTESCTVTITSSDTAGNTTTKIYTLTATASPLVITEVKAGSDAWVELYNTTDATLALSSFTLTTPTALSLTGTLAPHTYEVFSIPEALTDATLLYATTVIDATPAFVPLSVSYERYRTTEPGTLTTNWNTHPGTAYPHTGNDASSKGFENVTARNPYNPHTPPTENYTIKKRDTPYIASSFSIPPGITVTAEPGVVIKFLDAGLAVQGSFIAHGTVTEPIILTSLTDDTGGDTNYDGTASTPQAGDWRTLSVTGSLTGSHLTVAYGGWEEQFMPSIRILGGTLTLTDSLIAHSSRGGLIQESGSTSLTRTTITDTAPGANQYALHSKDGTLSIIDSAITENTNGLSVEQGTLTLTNTTFTRSTQYPVQIHQSVDPSHITGVSGAENGTNALVLGLSVPEGMTYSLGANTLPFQGGGVVYGTLIMHPGATVQCEGGTACSLAVYGTLTTLGTIPSDILFTSLVHEAGSWGGIRVHPGGTASLSGMTIQYAGREGTFPRAALSAHEATAITVTNSLITDSLLTGIDVTDTPLTVSNTTIQNMSLGSLPSFFHTTGVQLRGTSVFTPSGVLFSGVEFEVGS